MNTSSSAYSRNTVHIETGKSMLCKFDMSGQIEYTNSYYLDFSEYSIEEIIGKTALEIKHPEFPTTVFNHIMQHLYQKKKIHVLSKDQTKSGKYYWFVTNFHFKTDTNGEILSFYSYRLPAPKSIPKEITDLYDKLLKMEQYAGLKIAQNYFEGFLEEIDLSFEAYTRNLIKRAPKTPISDEKDKIEEDFFKKYTPKKQKGLFGFLKK